MVPFLKRLADAILARHRHELDRIAVVLPSRRAGLYLRKYLSEAAGTAIWSPEVLDPGALLARVAGLRQGSTTEMLLLLHGAHLNIAGSAAEPLEEFLRWAPTSLRDMSEIDAHLLDLDLVYKDLRAYHEIESWSFLGTQELSRSQEAARAQWSRMGELHRSANEHFAKHGIGSSGRIARLAADIGSRPEWQSPWQHLWVAGLNALDPATTKLLDHLSKRGLASFAWDSDHYYLDEPGHEAGRYLRRSIGALGPGSLEPGSGLMRSDRRIEQITVPDHIAAVQVAAEWAMRLSPEQREEAVIMMADESLLLPLLSVIPESCGKVNVTMGVPLEGLPVHGFIERFLSVVDGHTAGLLLRDSLCVLFEHPMLHRGDATHEFLGELARAPGPRIAPDHARRLLADVSFPDRTEASAALDAIASGTDLPGSVQLAIAWAAKAQAHDRLAVEQLYQLAQAERELDLAMARHGFSGMNSSTYGSVRARATRGQRLALFGEPLAGLQVMGLLETRAIDHAHVLVLGATEGSLGGSDQAQSWIPFDLRRHYGLPLNTDAEAITSYHVHRLLHHAEQVHLVHALGADGSASPTRFTAQWKHELVPQSRTTVREQVRLVALGKRMVARIDVSKNEDVIKRLMEIAARGFSPSALGTWLQCPLDFYFKYVLGLKDERIQGDALGSDVLGSAVHAALEDIYRPCIGSVLTATWIQGAAASVHARLFHHLAKEIPEEVLRTGDHRLRAAMATDALQRYLLAEARRCERMTIVPAAVEAPLSGILGIGVRIGGKCDRVERRNGLLHVLDVKTGSVNPGDLKLHGLERDQVERRHRYALQLLMYAFMAFQQDESLISLRAGIIPMRKASASEGLWLSIGGADVLDRSLMDDMGGLIGSLITELLDPARPFAHDHESKYCSFCVV